MMRKLQYTRSGRKDNNFKPINLGIQIRNFGPIVDASINLRPLTILIGPNNSGKSYAAMLAHSIVSSCTQIPRVPFMSRFTPYKRIENAVKRLDRGLHKCIESTNGTKIDIPQSMIEEVSHAYYEYIFNEKIPQELCRNFGPDLDGLARAGTDMFEIGLSGDITAEMTCQGGKLTAKKIPKLKLGISIKQDKDTMSHTFSIKSKKTADKIEYTVRDIDYVVRSGFLWTVLEDMLEKITSPFPSHIHYFPASRSGVLQAHKTISASMIRNAPYGGIEQMQIPHLSGAVSDFISSIIEMSDSRGPLFDMAQKLEEEMLGGQISLRSRSKHSIPEIHYTYLDHDIPLYRTSSTVSELAPLVLYLKHTIRRDSMMIIEEPEAHLHPRNQLVLARYMVKLVRSGINIILTTHSVFMLEQLSLFLRMGGVDKEYRHEKLGYGKDDYLREDEISAYVFSQASRVHGYNAQKIRLSAKDGIPQDEFTDVALGLHEKNTIIDYKRQEA